jgi:hypothetical protein
LIEQNLSHLDEPSYAMPASQKLELVYPMDLLNAPACAPSTRTAKSVTPSSRHFLLPGERSARSVIRSDRERKVK